MIENTQSLKKYVSVSESFEFDEFVPYIDKAQRTYLQRYVGRLYFEVLPKTGENLEIRKEAQKLVDCAMANFGYYLFTPYASLSLDASGMYNYESEGRSKITVWQLNDIRRDLLRAGHEAMDELLELLEKNTTVFEDWHNSYSTIYNELLVNSTSVFQKFYNISNSRQTFLSLQPAIRLVEDKLLKNTFCTDLLKHLKSSELKEKEIELKELLQQAVVYATVAKVCNEGIFELTATGIKMKFDALEYEKNIAVEKLDLLKNTSENLTADANQILKRAVAFVSANESFFTTCNGKPLIENETVGYKPIVTQSILGI